MKTCHSCEKILDLPKKKVGFRETCPFCEADLHVCKNCKFYIIGKPNDCYVPNTEYVRDREKYNFCEEFQFKENEEKENKSSKSDIENQLFGDSKEDDSDNSFDSLFKD